MEDNNETNKEIATPLHQTVSRGNSVTKLLSAMSGTEQETLSFLSATSTVGTSPSADVGLGQVVEKSCKLSLKREHYLARMASDITEDPHAEAVIAIKIGDVQKLSEIVKDHCKDKESKVLSKDHWINQLLISEDFDKTLLSVAIDHGQYDCMEVLLNSGGADPNIESSKDLETPMFDAIEAGDPKAMKILIDHGADLGQRKDNGMTLILDAINLSQNECLEVLLQGGSDPNQYNQDLRVTPLTFALHQSRYDSMEILLKAKAGPDYFVDQFPVTPLVLATKIEDIKAMKLLIDYGADINKKDLNGNTALHYASQVHSTEAIRFLKASGAGPVESRKNSESNDIGNFLSEHILREVEVQPQKTYIETQRVRIYCATWNINSQAINLDFDIKSWLGNDLSDPPDIYAVGFQELDMGYASVLFNSPNTNYRQWIQVVFHNLHTKGSYKIAKYIQLSGMMLIVFVKEEHCPYIRNIAAQTVGTGLMGAGGNKGGVAVRLEFHKTSICFVACHFAAHLEKVQKRNENFTDICKRMIFANEKKITDHDMIYWMGDLNYRIEGLDLERVKELIKSDNLEELLTYDQLRNQINQGDVFISFLEGRITFKPTYKYDLGTDVYDTSDKARIPSWTDRILWKGEHIECTFYRCHNEYKFSDHKPVSAMYSAGMKVVKTREEKMDEELTQIRAKVEAMEDLLKLMYQKLDTLL